MIEVSEENGISKEDYDRSIPCPDCDGYGFKPEYAQWGSVIPENDHLECDTCGGSGFVEKEWELVDISTSPPYFIFGISFKNTYILFS